MSGPFVRMVVQLVVAGASIFTRAFTEAYQQALKNAQQAGAQGARSAARSHGGMPVDEAIKILNITKQDLADSARIMQQYDKYFSQNDPSKGGSFYLQSKIYRAKECLEKEIEQEKATKKKKQQKASGEK